MPDPVIVWTIVREAGSLVNKLLEGYVGKTAEDSARKVIAKTYDQLTSSAVTTNSVRLLKVLYDANSGLGINQIQAEAEQLRERQEPLGKAIEQDVYYHLKYLGTFGLIVQVGGDFKLTRLGVAFIERARTDGFSYAFR